MKLPKTIIPVILVLCSVFAVCRGKVTAQNMSIGDKARWVGSFVGIEQPQIGASIYDAGAHLVSQMGAQGASILLGGLLMMSKDPKAGAVADVIIDHFADAYNKSGVAKWNQTMLKAHQAQLAGLVLSKLDIVGTVHDVTRMGSARMVMPLTKESKVNKDCYEDAMDVLDAVNEMQRSDLSWARIMFDATGKLPSGVLRGHMTALGSYESCLEIHGRIPKNIRIGALNKTSSRYPRDFDTKYCRATMTLKPTVFGSGVDTHGIRPLLTLGLCLPDSCKAQDVEGILRLGYVGRSLGSGVNDTEVYCPEERSMEGDTPAIVAVVILSIFGCLVLCGTLYELRQQFTVIEKNSSYKTNLKQDDHYDVIKERAENCYTTVNPAFVPDESKTNGDVKVQNGGGGIQNGSTGVGLPSGYMHHKEGDSIQPSGAPNGRGTETGSNHYVTVTVNSKEKSGTERKAPQRKDGTLGMFFKSFSIITNAPKLLSGKSGPGAITCLHGIRFFSITWIMLGHTYNYGLVKTPGVMTTVNFVDAIPMTQRFSFQAVVGAGYGVDTFYMISGMLLAFIQLKQMAKLKKDPKPGKIGYYVFYYYFHRFWRLTPMYMIILMIYTCLTLYLGNGPMWPKQIDSAEYCRENWWTNILYVNNLVHTDKQCMAWTWFLANDMQFYVVSIILLFFLTVNIKLGSFFVFLLMSAGIVSAGIKEHKYNGSFFTMQSDGGAFWNNVYITPWCRVAAFCVGLFLGVIFYKKPKANLTRTKAFIGWCVAVTVGFTLVYCTYSENKKNGETWSRNFRAVYESLGRPLWSVCVAWVIAACHYGRGGVVNSILSWSGLVPLSRMSYAVYLVHPIMMMIYVFSKRSLVYIANYDIIYLFLGHTVMSFMVAFVVSLAFEAPFMALEKLIIGGRK
ncbi:nose resistant to fluoxetine protein 6-like [Saccostrea cucullata]|uniref:nose resistant to fluoxetine protein 6-like n=1 Tax=Saccostrea cuccullata TaxID=36930 RepID=UPI002ED2FBBA